MVTSDSPAGGGGGGALTAKVGANVIFWPMFLKNCTKTRKIRSRWDRSA